MLFGDSSEGRGGGAAAVPSLWQHSRLELLQYSLEQTKDVSGWLRQMQSFPRLSDYPHEQTHLRNEMQLE